MTTKRECDIFVNMIEIHFLNKEMSPIDAERVIDEEVRLGDERLVTCVNM